jgi:hypothetical protein
MRRLFASRPEFEGLAADELALRRERSAAKTR